MRVGAMFRCLLPPERLIPFARLVDGLGLDELWLVEDCFWAGGIASTATALAVTERITVGLGVAPAVVRNPAVLAMEFAALARLHPGRFVAGIGHGVQTWMGQIGARPASPLAALSETIDVVRRLLRGESVNVDGRHVHLADVGLVYPAHDPPPVLAGVTGPRSLAMAGTVADGVLLPEYSSPAYIEAACRLMANQAASITTYAWFHVDDDRDVARAAVRRSLTPTSSLDAQLEPLGLTAHDIASAVPDDVLDQLAVVGTPRNCAAAISALYDAGAGSVVVLPALDQTEVQVTRLAQEVVPLLR
jgi:alkanesulfonate monooxygenase SsuD/methylene tetrahydromethanopterin reductase-like flavin-dependent oxidoreductase (luciferase family)